MTTAEPSSLTGWLSRAVRRQRRRPLLHATSAAGALVAMADYEVSLSEQLVLDALFETADRLHVYAPHEVVDLHRRYAEELARDRAGATHRLLAQVSRVAGDPAARRLVRRVGEAIARADGDVNAAERSALEQIDRALGLVGD